MNAMEVELVTARKLFWLMANDHIFFESRNPATGGWDDGAYPSICCNDFFVPAADSEPLAAEDLDRYIAVVRRWPIAGPNA